MKNKIKVYHLFWAVAIIVLLIGLILNDGTVDINVHDTYFVISYRIVSFALFLFYILNGLGYWSLIKILKRRPIKPLTIIHSVILIGSFITYWIIIAYTKYSVKNDPLDLYNYQLQNIFSSVTAFLIVFVAEPIYIVNLLVGLFRKKSKI
jgi:heme/copper-type cytochrome/quinol oxidase subunit 1